MVPAKVTFNYYLTARENLRKRWQNKPLVPKYRVYELVRISTARAAFLKGYTGGWSKELFISTRINTQSYPEVYYLRDLSDDDIDVIFYQEELTRVGKNISTETFYIDRVLKTSSTGRSKKLFVSWKGYPDKFNSWITASGLQNLQ
ncbi:uncharacterized protein LOC117180458 [Belonocnema kinseyi]|uniref:uncharacterized protein LOC117180458 n=1 Tax=Belonocnema kinseyi TaxID=2817044 RepID=UPI00143DCC06|nr:uncharacterized protein LOC117180458 [Belonocnema kinseyi]